MNAAHLRNTTTFRNVTNLRKGGSIPGKISPARSVLVCGSEDFSYREIKS